MQSRLALIAGATCLLGCAVTTGIVREQAAEEMNCPLEQVDARFEDDVFHVSGCELNATYVCSRRTPVRCRRVGLRGVPAAKREPIVRAKAAGLLDCDPAALDVARASQPGRYTAKGCGRRIEYECVTRGDCCAFGRPGAQPLGDAELPAEVIEAKEEHAGMKGSLSKAHIRAVIGASIGEVRACYEASLGGGPSPAGVVNIQFIIAPDGRVQIAAVHSSSLGDPEVEQCIAEATKRMRFAKPAGGGIVVVTYPYLLQLDVPGPMAECP